MTDDLRDILPELAGQPDPAEARDPLPEETPGVPSGEPPGPTAPHAGESDIISAILGAEQDPDVQTDLFGLTPEDNRPAQPLRKQRFLLLKAFLVLITLAVIGFAAFCIVWDVREGTAGKMYPAGDLVRVQILRQMEPHPASALVDENGKYSFEGIAETVMPSIVEIYIYKDSHMIGSGSGIILTQDGYIATNAHVIANAESLAVRLYSADDNRYTAAVIGRDNKTDLAILKIPASNLPPAVLGNSDHVRLGETVCALGNPAGLNSSITHVDFMVGTADLSIDGYTADGRCVPVFRDGNFVF